MDHLPVEEDTLIDKIATRAMNEVFRGHRHINYMDIWMDVRNVHTKVVKLQLGEMLKGNPSDFIHDVCGIFKHYDRDQEVLTDYFMPRFANQ